MDIETENILTSDNEKIAASEKTLAYHRSLKDQVKKALIIAEKARERGFDPRKYVEIYIAQDVATRTEGLVGPVGIAQRLKEMEDTGLGKDEIVIAIAREIALGKFGEHTKEQLANQAIRTALSYQTESVTAAPMEGISKVEIRKQAAGGDFLAVYYAGPIRSAGGTAQGVSVYIADEVRKTLGLDRYQATEPEVERMLEEVRLYNKIMHLQLPTSDDEIRHTWRNIPVMISGDPTEEEEVGGYRNIVNMETNRVRGGACLVLNDGLVGRAKKILKRIRNLKLEGWDWLDEIASGKYTDQRETEIKGKDIVLKVTPDYSFASDALMGRPTFSDATSRGGFRLRYGHARNTGIAAIGVHPATMAVVDDFLATGTHVRTERPGKGSIVVPIDTIKPPIVLMKSGEVREFTTYEEAKEHRSKITKILFLGDMLVGVGEFLQNNYRLVPPGYNEEWWVQEMNAKGWHIRLEEEHDIVFFERIYRNPPSLDEAITLAKKYNVAIHPKFTPAFAYIDALEIIELRKQIWQAKGSILEFSIKSILEKAFIFHTKAEKGLDVGEMMTLLKLCLPEKPVKAKDFQTGLELVQKIAEVKIRDIIGTTVGARMGRPEKAKPRLMKPMLHGLFPVGENKQLRKELGKAIKFGNIKVNLSNRYCEQCNFHQFNIFCERCDEPTTVIGICRNRRCGKPNLTGPCDYCGGRVIYTKYYEIDINSFSNPTRKRIGSFPDVVKLKEKITNPEGIPELLDKGVLRAIKNLNVFRDGTIRYDATDAPLTHFYPHEIKTSVDKLKSIGYSHDIFGKPLENLNQLLEMKVQDIIVHESGIQHFLDVAEFIDKELSRIYGLDPFYNARKATDLVGQLVIGLAPHTSAGVIGRIIGFTTSSVCWAHPFWHSSKRRNCIEYNEELLLWNVKTQKFIQRPIGEIVNEVLNGKSKKKIVDDFGTIQSENPYPHLQVFGIDEKTKKTILQPIKYWIKGKTNSWIKIKTETGRSLTMTEDHTQLILNGEIRKIKASDLKIGDKIPIMHHLPVSFNHQDQSIETKINILHQLSEKLPRIPKFNKFRNDLRIRDIQSWLLIKLGTFAQSNYEKMKAGLVLKLGPKQTSSYLREFFNDKFPIDSLANRFDQRWYKSLPLSHLEVLIDNGVFNWEDLPSHTMLGIARNDSKIRNFMGLNKNLMRLIGYYVSEGYSRDEYGCYQINFSVPNKDIREHVRSLIQDVFNKEPYHKEDNDQLVVVSKIHMYLFTYAWNMKHSALTKRLPKFVLNESRSMKLQLLSAIIDGDGSLSDSKKFITIYTGSKDLASDYAQLTGAVGVFSRIHHQAKVRYGKKILERYRELGTDPKKGKGLYSVTINGLECYRIIKELNFVHKRKSKIQKNIMDLKSPTSQRLQYFNSEIIMDKIKSIEIVDDLADTFCLEIDGENHNFATREAVTSNCDGDEDGLILLMDGFLNFSKQYLPTSRGSKMDTPLVLVVTLNPNEVDDEAFNLDTTTHYNLDFYDAACKMDMPGKVSADIPRAENRLGTPDQFENFVFSHSTSNISAGPLVTRYKDSSLNIRDKLNVQLALSKVIGAVNVRDTALKIFERHALPDLQGNLRAFASQKFRCINCNTKYRRVPLDGKCKNSKCEKSNLILTVPPKGVSKYFDICEMLVADFQLGIYHENRLERIKMSLDSLFPEETKKVMDFSEWF